MLNYIWAGLIAFSLVFALAYDTRDLMRDTYRNGEPLALQLEFPDGYDANARRQNVSVRISASSYSSHFGVVTDSPLALGGVLITTRDGSQIRFAESETLPEPLHTIRDVTSTRENDLRGPLSALTISTDDPGVRIATVSLPRVRFIKMQSIADAALDMAEIGVNLALGLIGIIALWMGLLQIAEKAGLIEQLVRFTQPIVRPLFPEIPKDHPAIGLIVLNLTANMLGLGNAATPLGLKAMESLQELNPTEDTATNSMVMLLAMNTASVQLVPPVLLVALMGLQVNQLIFAIIITTSVSLVVAVTVARLLSKIGSYGKSDPMKLAASNTQTDEGE
jgi:spore maturation protein A